MQVDFIDFLYRGTSAIELGVTKFISLISLTGTYSLGSKPGGDTRAVKVKLDIQ